MRTFASTAFLFLVVCSAALATNKVVYFAIRTDDPTLAASWGTGTSTDPYDGRYYAGVSRFDQNMQVVTKDFFAHPPTDPANQPNTINLAQGTYWTWGDDGNFVPHDGTDGQPTRGFLLPAGTMLTGAGMDRSIIKLLDIDQTVRDGGVARTVVASGNYGGYRAVAGSGPTANCTYVTVANLTVDCNSDRIWPLTESGQYSATGIGIFGVVLNGSNDTVRKTKVIHAYAVNPRETAGISMLAMSADSTNFLVDSCVVDAPVGGYSNGIGAFPGPNPSHRISGTIQYCQVFNNPWAAYNVGAGTSANQMLLIGNTATDVEVGYHWDTGSIVNTHFKYNTFITRDIDFSNFADVTKYHIALQTIGDPAHPQPPLLNVSRAIELGSYSMEGSTVPVELGNFEVTKNYFLVPGYGKGFMHFARNGQTTAARPDVIFSYFEISQNTFASDSASNQIFALDVDDGHNDADEVADGKLTWESTHWWEVPAGTEADMTVWFQDIRFEGGNVMQGSAFSQLWRPKYGTITYQNPSTSMLPPQLPDVRWNLPTTGTAPTVSITAGGGMPSPVSTSPFATYNVKVGDPVSFSVAPSASGLTTTTLASYNLPAGASTSVALPYSYTAFPPTVALSWTPSIDQVGPHTISFIADNGLTTYGVVSVNVLPNPAIHPVAWGASTGVFKDAFPAGSWAEKSYPATDGAWNSQIISSERILGDGGISFRFPNTGKTILAGLSFSNPGVAITSTASPEYAFASAPGGNLWVMENGTSVGGPFGAPISTFTSGDLLTISRQGGVVKYYKNSTLLRTAPAVENRPVFPVAHFYNSGAAVADATITNGVPSEDVTWTTNAQGGSPAGPCAPGNPASGVTFIYPTDGSGSTATKTTGTAASCDCEALSNKSILGDGFFSFKFASVAKTVLVGLSTASPNLDPLGPDYAMIMRPGTSPTVQIQDFWGNPRGYWPCTVNDVYTIVRKGDTASYYQNGTLMITSVWKTTLPLRAEYDGWDLGAAVTNCVYGGATTLKQVDWQNLVNATKTLETVGTFGSKLEKPAGGATAGDSEGVSTERIVGDGYVEFRYGSTDKNVTMALSARNRDLNLNNAEFQMISRPDVGGIPQVQIVQYVDGVHDIILGYVPFAAADTFRIARENGIVNFYKNGAVVATATTMEPLPLMVECDFYEPGGSVVNCVYSGGTPFEAIGWQTSGAIANIATASDRGSVLQKSGADGWDANATSLKSLATGDGMLQFQFQFPAATVSLSLVDASNAVQYSFSTNGYVDTAPFAEVTTPAGAGLAWAVNLSSADVFTIWRKGNVLQTYRNATLMWTQSIPTGPLKLVCYPYHHNSGIFNCNYGGITP